VDARPVLGVPSLWPPFLVHLPAAGSRQTQDDDGAGILTSSFSPSYTTRFRLDDDLEDDPDDDEDDEDDEDEDDENGVTKKKNPDDEDGDEDDEDDEEDEDDDEDGETWQVAGPSVR